MSGYEWDFVHWPFKRAPVSLADSCLSLVNRIPTNFYSQMLCGCLFPALALWDGEPPEQGGLGVQTPPLFSQGTFAAEISLQNLSHSPWD